MEAEEAKLFLNDAKIMMNTNEAQSESQNAQSAKTSMEAKSLLANKTERNSQRLDKAIIGGKEQR